MRRDAQEEVLTIPSPSSAAANMCPPHPQELFLSLIEGIFRSFPVHFQLLASPRHICDI